MNRNSKHIVVVGGGYVGLYTVLRLQRTLRRELREGSVRITVLTPESHMTYQPFLPEAAAGNLSPRHVVVPLRRVLPKATILNGKASKIDHAAKRVYFEPNVGTPYEIDYDIVVMAAGSVSRTLPIPGLADAAIGFKTVGEAIALRNRVLGLLDRAESNGDEGLRRRALTFVVVGGGFAGIEALAELEDMALDAVRYYHNVRREDLRWVLVEATDRILPEVGPEMGMWTAEQLRERGIEVKMNTRLESCESGLVKLSDGDEFEAATIVWTAGVKPSPVVNAGDLPLDERGRIKTSTRLTVVGVQDAFAAGDVAGVPDVTNPGQYCAPNAQHAVRQAKVLADNITRHLHGQELLDYRHKYVGSVAGLGLHKGVANVYGVKLRGLPAWFMHRTYHLSRVPTLNRKVRVMADWTLALFFKRETVSLGEIEAPREEFRAAATT
ncbi:NAD(P)/FAD-dependent oxidoreductase [Planomonospora parontospora]|uniref:NAD(P)/FAD-dependent oxidoreductase n=1 Tax=Planomonospora parontospora TaxID=58119 RepID=UPI0016714D49|nr:NAD(P)/FAD-dependent oxidoreductase [Planomonospora parontospora]GGL11524.1 NADH dehydrogenase [Planomonospora parontospora subsp. antibiotica]GII14889.1 NADH dehydrogenase [Planomonospora parontospora subsp. antibiotica]